MQLDEAKRGGRRSGLRWSAGSRCASAALARNPVWTGRHIRDGNPARKTAEGSELKCWQGTTRFWRTLVVVKRKELNQSSSLERGSAATRTVVRSISPICGSDELTHISRINRR